MEKRQIIFKVAKQVKALLQDESSGHDWWHAFRVWKMAERIAKKEKANEFVVSLAALLHDIADWKFYDGDESEGPKQAAKILRQYGVQAPVIQHVCQIIKDMSFKGAKVKTPMKTLEGKIAQDADRLDALGAIGIARAFAFGSYKRGSIYDPKIKPAFHRSKQQYFANKSSTINHFYEKLLLLKDRMNTKTARSLALGRHKFMVSYLKKFFKEWKGKQ